VSYDPDKMAQIAHGLFQVQVEAVHGEAGTNSLKAVLALARELYRFRSPEGFSDGLVIFHVLPDGAPALPIEESQTVPDVQSLPEDVDGTAIEILPSGGLRVWSASAVDPQLLATHAVVYAFGVAAIGGAETDGADFEAIILPDGPAPVPNPVGYPSALAPPTFWNLEEALDYYATHLAARSTCKILKTVWAQEAADRRLVLRNHPEVVMRESLAQHLRSSVRDTKLVRVLEEQNVSETEPVDIEVSWSLTSHIALIEVKWLGKCLNDTGDALASYSYSDGRARDGVRQLADYLDEFRERTPGHEIRGYLVVYDARRWGVTTWEPGEITSENAWYYANRDIDYLDAIPDRSDFKPPRRLYLEPRIAA
jgi:hypothetical protein